MKTQTRARITMDYGLAMAIAQDAGNVSMRAAHRTAWNDDDWNAMCDGFKRAARCMPLDLRRCYFTDEEMAQ